MSITEILKTNPEIAGDLNIKVNVEDLKTFAELCFEKGRQEKPEQPDPEEYLTPQEYADTLKISLVTLWTWDNKGITRPLRIGNKKRYRRSDLEKIMSNA